jgi:hypothetical protein
MKFHGIIKRALNAHSSHHNKVEVSFIYRERPLGIYALGSGLQFEILIFKIQITTPFPTHI